MQNVNAFLNLIGETYCRQLIRNSYHHIMPRYIQDAQKEAV